MSRRPSTAAPEAQGVVASSSDTNSQDSTNLPKPTTDHLVSVEDLDSNERLEKKEETEDKENTLELSTDESATKMEVDPTESRSDEEQSMTECDLLSHCIVFNYICSMYGALFHSWQSHYMICTNNASLLLSLNIEYLAEAA